MLFGDYGPELSRAFRGLKVWLCFKAHGISTYGRLIDGMLPVGKGASARG